MIKRFEQYIKEKLNIKTSFKFSDNFQALFDMFEKDIDILAYGNLVKFQFSMPTDMKQLKTFLNNMQEFVNELEVIFESLVAENLKYGFKISNNNNHFILDVHVLEKTKFDEEMFEYAVSKLECEYSFYIDNGAYVQETSLEMLSNEDDKIIFKIWSADSNTVNTNLIDENILPLIAQAYKIKSKEITYTYDEGAYEDDDVQEIQVYEIKAEKI